MKFDDTWKARGALSRWDKLSFVLLNYWHTNQDNCPDPPSPTAHAVGELPCGSQPTATTCVVWSWCLKECFTHVLSPAVKSLWNTGSPIYRADGKGETAVHGYHWPDDMAVCMREVLARPWVGVGVPLTFVLSGLASVCLNYHDHYYYCMPSFSTWNMLPAQ